MHFDLYSDLRTVLPLYCLQIRHIVLQLTGYEELKEGTLMTTYANIRVKLRNGTDTVEFHACNGAPDQLGYSLATASFWEGIHNGSVAGNEALAMNFLGSVAEKGFLPEADYIYEVDLGCYSASSYGKSGDESRTPLLQAVLADRNINPTILRLLTGGSPSHLASAQVNSRNNECGVISSESGVGLISAIAPSASSDSAGRENLKSRLKWVSRYFKIAELVSTWSKDPSSKVGAIIVGDKGQIISQGYNGFPRGVADTPERYNTREIKYKLVVHAEMNAILNALYNGSSVVGAAIYIHNLPVCQECAKAIIQAGISEVFIDTRVNERWQEAWNFSKMMFSECGVKCYYYNEQENTLTTI